MLDEYTKLKEGDFYPVNKITLVSGKEIILMGMSSPKPVLINFFIKNCSFCRKAMYFIENQVWHGFNDRIIIVSIGREHTVEEIIGYQQEKGWSFPLAADPDQKIYKMFAERKVPRSYLFDNAGKMIFQIRGFEEELYNELLSILDTVI